jgi:ubiquinone/menaquinone biosynthesis C-methylase UbiE
MAHRVCPPWIGYLLLNPLRKLLENPEKILGPLVQLGMIVLEPGCGMGYFTLPLARMVGSNGRVVAVEVQPKMLSVLSRRAQKAGLSDRIELRQTKAESLGVEYLLGKVDFATALHMVHEVPDQSSFFAEVLNTLKPGGKLFVIEPKNHVSQQQFDETIAIAKKTGFKIEAGASKAGGRRALLLKPLVGE